MPINLFVSLTAITNLFRGSGKRLFSILEENLLVFYLNLQYFFRNMVHRISAIHGMIIGI